MPMLAYMHACKSIVASYYSYMQAIYSVAISYRFCAIYQPHFQLNVTSFVARSWHCLDWCDTISLLLLYTAISDLRYSYWRLRTFISTSLIWVAVVVDHSRFHTKTDVASNVLFAKCTQHLWLSIEFTILHKTCKVSNIAGCEYYIAGYTLQPVGGSLGGGPVLV